jgi:glucuronate isomerase
LDARGKLAKTILYSINPNDNDALATMVGNFNDGSFPGKVQLGAAWWFNDQMDGMINHLKSVGNMGLLSRFVGMLTDSRSFLSFPRHEYFRRILCNFLGEEMKKGRLPNDEKWIGSIVQDICYNNAKHYFDL